MPQPRHDRDLESCGFQLLLRCRLHLQVQGRAAGRSMRRASPGFASPSDILHPLGSACWTYTFAAAM